jgi:hypothetical protein
MKPPEVKRTFADNTHPFTFACHALPITKAGGKPICDAILGYRSQYLIKEEFLCEADSTINLQPVSFSIRNLQAGLYKVCLSEKHGSNDCQSFIVL